jgi:GH24 family phage-related lysozyme (muramidase)
LVSLVFNCGQKYTPEIVSLANAGNYSAMPNFIEGYKTGHGNARRRRQEAAMFKNGNYDAAH